MRKYVLLSLPLMMVILSSCAHQAGVTAGLGEKFNLAIGQSATITGEDLEIRFAKVIGDSRCPQGVECFWAGEVSSQIEITYAGSSYEKVLTQSDASATAQTDFGDYIIKFDFKPYPKAGEKIKDKDYRLELQINKKSSG
jgi:hypothetical protein